MPSYLVSNLRGQSKIIIALQPLTSQHFEETDLTVTPLTECDGNSLSHLPVYVQSKSIQTYAYYFLNGNMPLSFEGLGRYAPFGFWPSYNEPLPKELIEKLLQHNQKTLAEDMIKKESEEPYTEVSLQITKDRKLLGCVFKEKDKQSFIHRVENPNFVASLGLPVPQFVSILNDNGATLSFCEEFDRWSEAPLSCLLDVTPNAWYEHMVRPYFNIIKTLHDRSCMHGDITETNVIFSSRFNQLFFIDFECFKQHDIQAYACKKTQAYHDWHNYRLIDIKDMCDSILYNTKVYAKNHQNTPLAANQAVMDYLKSIAEKLEAHDFYMGCNQPFELLESYESLTIQSIIDHVHMLMETQPDNLYIYGTPNPLPQFGA